MDKQTSEVIALSRQSVQSAMPARMTDPIELTIVVPTFNESGNIQPLVDRLGVALAGIEWEVVFVDDDSPDHTADVVSDIAQSNRRVRRLQRVGRRGLSTACIEGIMSSSAPFVAVMDGDLQHDEAILPAMLGAVKDRRGDLAVGSRYAQGGSMGQWDEKRQGMSKLATQISKLLTGVELSDPMSGYFLMRREAFNLVVRDLSGLGFKILLDIAATGKGRLKVVEIPYTFRERTIGESKLDSQALWEFLMLLLDKRFGKFVPVRFVSFAMIGGSGVLVHFAVLSVLLELAKAPFLWSQLSATIAAMVSNYGLNNMITYRDRRRTGWGWYAGLATFMIACSVGAFANIGIANYLYSDRTDWALAALAGIVAGTVWNYAVTAFYTWKR